LVDAHPGAADHFERRSRLEESGVDRRGRPDDQGNRLTDHIHQAGLIRHCLDPGVSP
jgi:hypothetical protein